MATGRSSATSSPGTGRARCGPRRGHPLRRPPRRWRPHHPGPRLQQDGGSRPSRRRILPPAAHRLARRARNAGGGRHRPRVIMGRRTRPSMRARGRHRLGDGPATFVHEAPVDAALQQSGRAGHAALPHAAAGGDLGLRSSPRAAASRALRSRSSLSFLSERAGATRSPGPGRRSARIPRRRASRCSRRAPHGCGQARARVRRAGARTPRTRPLRANRVRAREPFEDAHQPVQPLIGISPSPPRAHRIDQELHLGQRLLARRAAGEAGIQQGRPTSASLRPCGTTLRCAMLS